jgi:carbohydrate kinase (thermoresistant glucokinase family)
MIVVVMGVSGAGKTTVGELLARRLGLPFVEGDDLHPPANVAKMAAGNPLTDAERAPWLRALAARIRAAAAAGLGLVVACSALRRSYREMLRAAAPGVRFVFLQGSRELLQRRLAARRGHFMAADLLDSQLATLEPPGTDEDAWTVGIDRSPDEIVDTIVGLLRPPP